MGDLTLSHFPQEIMDTIIDNFKWDAPVLSACSLVCRSWCHRSQSHLFRVVWRVMKNYQTFAFSPLRKLELFEQFLQSSPRICTYIRKLLIYKSDCPFKITIELLFSLLHKLPTLEFLSLDNVYVRNTSDAVSVTEGSLPKLSVVLSMVTLSSDTFYRFLSAFSAIDTLYLSDVLLTDTDCSSISKAAGRVYIPPITSAVVQFRHGRQRADSIHVNVCHLLIPLSTNLQSLLLGTPVTFTPRSVGEFRLDELRFIIPKIGKFKRMASLKLMNGM